MSEAEASHINPASPAESLIYPLLRRDKMSEVWRKYHLPPVFSTSRNMLTGAQRDSRERPAPLGHTFRVAFFREAGKKK